ncbi:bifunctional P-loop containing nucleoside triphosphate hydrolase/Ribosomal protein S5 domain 2-type fold [Babesia duncani]|uniref:Bifunctional P-loop containing nucleoside triphosphate hydrolase/Ribosomal protein S5 domain 2-type fold n=1 Tax=Babesia duncani TaxID=323732 RepID=A0AAD9UPW9_9APIC|nr:bifunctional P-loop containing nucleoside triphosphate hydrolase/Ribosomal protein S5 domain 2-type fold [Babesia duncani]
MAHINAGKTTLAESILYTSKRISSMGNINDGTTLLDYMEQEIKRGITIRSACTSFDWKDYHINLVDTPGHTDFSGEVYKAMDVVDGCIIVIDGTKGVQAQTRQINNLLPKHIPRLFFINKIDRQGVSITENIKSIKQYLSNTLVFLNKFSKDPESEDIVCILDREHVDGCKLMDKVIESIANFDDDIATRYLCGDNVPRDEMLKSLKKLVQEMKTLKNIGIEALLNVACQVFPSPLLEKEKVCLIVDTISEATTIYTFKAIANNPKDINAFCKVLTGTAASNTTRVFNLMSRQMEKCGKIYKIHGKTFTECSQLIAGDIGMIRGFKSIRAGHVLSSNSNVTISQQLLESHLQDSAKCVCFATITPKNSDQNTKLLAAMENLKIEDVSLFYKHEPESEHGLTIGGYGEFHFEILADILKNDYGIPVTINTPRVAFKECPVDVVTASVNLDETLAPDTNLVALQVEMGPMDTVATEVNESSFDVMATRENNASHCIVDFDGAEIRGNNKHVENIKAGIKRLIHNTMASGPAIGGPLIYTRVNIKRLHVYPNSSLVGLLTLEIKTLPGAKATAARVMRDIYKTGKFQVLEPIMSLNIQVPNEYVGAIVKDLRTIRRCSFIKVDHDNQLLDSASIIAHAPMRLVLGYTGTLRSLTNGNVPQLL